MLIHPVTNRLGPVITPYNLTGYRLGSEDSFDETDCIIIQAEADRLNRQRTYYDYADDVSIRNAVASTSAEEVLQTTLSEQYAVDADDVDTEVSISAWNESEALSDSDNEVDEDFNYEDVEYQEFDYIFDPTNKTRSVEDNEIISDYNNLLGMEYDEEASHDEFDTPTRLGKIPRHRRARDEAIDLCLRTGWDQSGIDVLTKIFYRYGWSNTKKALMPKLENGIKPIELDMAEQVRELWSYYPVFSKYYTHCRREKQQSNGYLPWSIAIALVCSFDSYPDMAEIEFLLLELYEHWISNDKLISTYSCFQYYLFYRITRQQGDELISPWFDFDSDSMADEYSSSDVDSEIASPRLAGQLLELGYDLESMEYKAIHRIQFNTHL